MYIYNKGLHLRDMTQEVSATSHVVSTQLAHNICVPIRSQPMYAYISAHIYMHTLASSLLIVFAHCQQHHPLECTYIKIHTFVCKFPYNMYVATSRLISSCIFWPRRAS